MAMSDTSVVPATRGRMPKRGVEKSGVHSVPVRNSSSGTSRRNANVSTASTAMIATVVATESSAQRSSTASIRNSTRFTGGRPRRRALREVEGRPGRGGRSLLPREELFERHPDLRTAGGEGAPELAFSEVLLGQVVELRRELDVADFAN